MNGNRWLVRVDRPAEAAGTTFFAQEITPVRKAIPSMGRFGFEFIAVHVTPTAAKV
jgi:hypothetical protein